MSLILTGHGPTWGQAGAGTSPAHTPEIAILYPPDGLVVTPGMCVEGPQGLQLPVVVAAPVEAIVYVNGELARGLLPADRPPSGRLDTLGLAVAWDGDVLRLDSPGRTAQVDGSRQALFHVALPLHHGVLDLEALAAVAGWPAVATCTAYGRTDRQQTYAITVDDVADALAELTRCGRACASLFDNPTLGFMRRMHEEYGTVFSLYLFEQGTIFHDFHLSQMPDRFQQEWAANASWLRLGFHAQSMPQPAPYRQATYDQALADLLAVRQEVGRFAGEAAWDPFSRTHWWSGSLAACRAWRDAGARGLYAAVPEYPGYYLSAEQNALTQRCDYWRDHTQDQLFVQTDLWVERDFASTALSSRTSSERVGPLLDSLSRAPAGSHSIAILAHEFFPAGHPEVWHVAERLEEAIVWLNAHGYQPRLAADDPFLASLPPVPPRDVRADVGHGVELEWTHPRPDGVVRYGVEQRDLSEPTAPWQQVGETALLSLGVPPPAGAFEYRVVARDTRRLASGGSRTVSVMPSVATAVTEVPAARPAELRLAQNYPNPFNGVTVIPCELPEEGEADLDVFDLRGGRVRRLSLGWAAAGRHQALWDGRDDRGRPVASGTYLYRLQSGSQAQTRRLVVLQ